MAERYEQRISHQKLAIDRLTEAHLAMTDALTAVQYAARDIRAARKMAEDTLAKVKDILAVPEEPDGFDGLDTHAATTSLSTRRPDGPIL